MTSPVSSGYSDKPLEQKLGFKDGFDILMITPPENYFALFDRLPEGISFHGEPGGLMDIIHVFVYWKNELDLTTLKKQIKQNGMVWVSWPKKASKVPTDMDENFIREYALSVGLVDVKVCAVDATWSGLKLVIPVKDRK